jgi:two-component system, OmpR family, sensor histidine kinase TctE
MMIQPVSLRGRLVWPLSGLLLLLAIISSADAYRNARIAANTAYDRTLLAAARSIAQRLGAHEGVAELDVAFIALDPFSFDATGRIYYQANGPDGRWISGFESMPAPPDDLEMTADYPALARFYDAEYRGQPVRMVSLLQPLPVEELPGAMAEIRVGETLQARHGLTRSLLREIYWRQGVLVLCGCLLLILAVRGALRPMEQLRGAVATQRLDDLRPVAPAHMPRELQPLVAAINYWSGRLRSLFERQRRFIADATHQLRTPLSILKSRLELALRDEHPTQWREALQAALAASDRMVVLANRLLSMARIESGIASLMEGSASPVDMKHIARDLGIAMAPLARARDVDLSLDVRCEFAVSGDETLLQEMLGNLLDNALRHAAVQGHVVVRLLAPRILEIEDDGPGLPPQVRARLFQPFVSGHAQGTGLGLTIAADIARAHGASIELLDRPDGGTLVRIDFDGAPSRPRPSYGDDTE